MVDFEYWYGSVISEAELITSKEALVRKWIDKEQGITSAYDQHELLEQLLGDLDLEECLQYFGDKLRELQAFDAVSQFASAVLVLSQAIDANPKLEDPKELSKATEWEALREQAQKLIDLPSSALFRDHRYE